MTFSLKMFSKRVSIEIFICSSFAFRSEVSVA